MRVAVTGGVGSGKSTVSGLLAAHGAVVVDADAIAHEVVEPGTPGLAAVAEAFGSSVLRADGALDRAALAGVVFTDADARRRLESILHPFIRRLSDERLAAVAADRVAVYDVPLLTESGPQGRDAFDVVVVVRADADVRIERLGHRGLAADDARRRIAAQASDDERAALADVVIDNSGSRSELDSEVATLWDRLPDLAAGRPTPGSTGNRTIG